MLVKKIEAYAQAFEQMLKKRRELPHEFFWESVVNFLEKWDGAAPDFAAMYDSSLQNSQTRRLWKGDNYEPKAMMLKLIAMDPEFSRRMFHDLFDEQVEVEMRISRFKFGCETLLGEYKQQHKMSIENRHYHEDNQMISFYLFFRYPALYCPFEYEAFQASLRKLGNTDIPGPYEIGRYYKLLRILQKFLLRHEGIWPLYRQSIPASLQLDQPSLMLVYDFCYFCQRHTI